MLRMIQYRRTTETLLEAPLPAPSQPFRGKLDLEPIRLAARGVSKGVKR